MSFSKSFQLEPGRVLIINHKEFTEREWNCQGSEKDVDLLKKHFGQYNVPSRVILNPTLEEVQKKIKKMQDYDFTKNSCFICAILSHGDKNNVILSSDLECYSLENDIVKPIQRNKTLFGKPKIFIVQLSKGDVELNEILEKKKINETRPDYAKSSKQRDPGKCWKFCITTEDFALYRNKENQSIFIRSLCDMLKIYGTELSIEEIFDLASKEIQKKTSEIGLKQTPCKEIQQQMNYIFGNY